MTSRTPTKLPTATSVLLDVVRFGASLMVAIGHLTQPFFSTGWPNLITHAVEAVAVFFVLSGFVIRYVTRLKYGLFREYAVDRAARIYSVVLPAVLFTVIADAISRHVNPAYYNGNWGMYATHPGDRLIQNLLFTSQFWSRSTALFSNGPFWSLSYEVVYYAIYGCVFYLRGVWRWIAAAGLIALGGAHIALLFPLWLLGCLLYDLYERLSRYAASWRTHALFALAALTGILLRSSVIATIFAAKGVLAGFLLAHHHRPPNLHWMLDYYRVGIPTAFLLLWGGLVVDRLRMDARAGWVRVVRKFAEGTFPLYLFHFPLYVLIASVIPYAHESVPAKLLMLLTVVTAGILLAQPTDWLKDRLRQGMRRLLLPHRPLPVARSAETLTS